MCTSVSFINTFSFQRQDFIFKHKLITCFFQTYCYLDSGCRFSWLLSILVHEYAIESNQLPATFPIFPLPTVLEMHSGCCLVTKSRLTLLQPRGLKPSRLLCRWSFPGRHTGMGCHFLLQGIFSDPGIKPKSLALTGGFFTTEPPRKCILGARPLYISFFFLWYRFLQPQLVG